MANLYQIQGSQHEKNRHAIFIHGLGGDAYLTWQSSSDIKTCWLYWLDEDIHDLAVWTVAYGAAVSRWRGAAMHLADRAVNVLERILLEPQLQSGEIDLVGHSLGGLVIKQLLRAAESLAYQRADVAGFLTRVRRVAFLATPHSGSGLASLGDRLRIFVRPSAATACLVRNDPFLRELTYWYREWSVKHSIHHLILIENQPIRIAGFVVKPDSSDPGLLTRPISVDADHFTICKPLNRHSEIYLLVRDFIERNLPSDHAESNIESILLSQSHKLKEVLGATQELQVQFGDAFSSLNQTVIEQSEKATEQVKLAANAALNGSILPTYPKELINCEIEKCLSVIRRARFIVGFNTSEHSVRLAEKIEHGEFAGGSEDVKSRALAWCARFLAIGDYGTKSDGLINTARLLGNGIEITVAEAFRISASGILEDALSKLAKMDSPIARTAAFMIVAKHKDPASSVDWLSKSGISFTDLDADGKFFLISKLFELRRWEEAFQYAADLKEKDFQEAPVLLHAAAFAHLFQTIPDDFRSWNIQQILFQAGTIPLASNEAALNNRKKAQTLFNECALAARELNCMDAANTAEDFVLLLELRDPECHGSGLHKLQTSMRDPAHSLRRLCLALQFGIRIDIAAVEQEIDRQTAVSGGKSQVAAMARFALVFIQKTPKDAVTYIDRHRSQLQEYLEKKSLDIIEVEMLARAGASQRAEELLKELSLSDTEQNRLQRIIAESVGADPIGARKGLFENSGQIYDLINLVNLLEERNDQAQLCHYGLQLFERTRALRDFERLAIVYSNMNQYAKLTALLKKYPEFIDQSNNLQLLWSWSLFWEGLLGEAKTALEKLPTMRDLPNYRVLLVNLAITSGDWESLQSHVESEWNYKEERDANELIKSAHLAQVICSPRAKDLLYLAASKGVGSAQILSTAYFLACNAGWENEANVAQWLYDAANLSGDNGPIKRMSVQDLIEQAPVWNRRQIDIWSQLYEGTIPIFGAAHLLNRSLIDLFLLPALANLSELNVRNRGLIPAYSGIRQAMSCNYRVVAMEATALLTLGYLGLLETIYNFFDSIYIPHSTLGWLFTEKQKVSFHQPSQIRNAHKIRQLLATDALIKFSGTDEIDCDLSAEIGEELASLIAEAGAEGSGDQRQKLVIRSSPVLRVGSLMQEEADLSAYYPYLCSCLAVVNKLKQKGLLTASEESLARSYLLLHEREWPCQPEISDDAVLYLDDLSMTYLQHAGVLDKLCSASFEVYISTQRIQEVNGLLSYEQLTSEVIRVIEYIRSKLAEGIKTGKVKVGHMSEPYFVDEAAPINNHPTFAIYHLAKDVEAVIVDDRFLNQHMNIDVNSALTPVLTTLDLLNTLHAMGHLTFEQFIGHRTSLRRGGYIFIPITTDELEHYFSASEVRNGHLQETAELKAIRENVLSIRMRKFIHLPKEANWIANSMQALTHALRAQWRDNIDEATARARSEWLLKQRDIRGWVHCYDLETGMNVLFQGYGAQVMSLLFAPSQASPEAEEKYLLWVEECLLAKLKEEEPDIYESLISRAQELITNTVNSAIAEEYNDGI